MKTPKSLLLTIHFVLAIWFNNCLAHNYLDSNARLVFEYGVGASKELKYSNQGVQNLKVPVCFNTNFNMRFKLSKRRLVYLEVSSFGALNSFKKDSMKFESEHNAVGLKFIYNLKPLIGNRNFEIGLGASLINSVIDMKNTNQENRIHNGLNPFSNYSSNNFLSSKTFIFPAELSYVFKSESPKYFRLTMFYNFNFQESEIKNLTKINYSTFGLMFTLPVISLF